MIIYRPISTEDVGDALNMAGYIRFIQDTGRRIARHQRWRYYAPIERLVRLNPHNIMSSLHNHWNTHIKARCSVGLIQVLLLKDGLQKRIYSGLCAVYGSKGRKMRSCNENGTDYLGTISKVTFNVYCCKVSLTTQYSIWNCFFIWAHC